MATRRNDAPPDVRALYAGLAKAMTTMSENGCVGDCKWGGYLFYDYDGDPIYASQTYLREPSGAYRSAPYKPVDSSMSASTMQKMSIRRGRAHMKRKRPLIYATSGRPRASRLHPNQPIIMLAGDRNRTGTLSPC